jgi:transposase
MPASISNATKARIEAKIELGMAPLTIFEEEHVALRTIQRFATNYRRFGSIQAPKSLKQGRPRTITPEMEEVSPLFVFCRWFYIR